MGRNSAIAWTDHTANFWWGCQKVDQGCAHCYAETLSKRLGDDIWGPPKTTHRRFIKSTWSDLVKWDKDARLNHRRDRVFVMSMGDFLEDHPDVAEPRERAMKVLENLTNLDVLLLTKRPENAWKFLMPWMTGWPWHIWFGTSIAEQADVGRVEKLLSIPAKVLWLSIEPLVGAIDLDAIPAMVHVDWVIAGGESGAGCRPMDVQWARDIRDGCKTRGIPFFMKQIGGHPKKLDQMADFPADLRIREFPT